MRPHVGAGLVGRITRALPCRRWQAAHWLGKMLAPRRPFVGRFRGGLMEVHPGEVASTAAFYLGFYEREVTSYADHLIATDPPALVVDVGANFGYYALLFGLVGSEVIAFEPDPVNFAWLGLNVAMNPGVNCQPFRAAVGAATGLVNFEASEPGKNLWAKVGDGKITAPLVALDCFLDMPRVADVPLTIIDVEGHECEVVKGMAAGIAAHRYRRVVVEFHRWAFEPNPERAAAELTAPFLAAGYTGHRFRRHPETGREDKERAYYDLSWKPENLTPLSYENLTVWEHFLFCAPGVQP